MAHWQPARATAQLRLIGRALAFGHQIGHGQDSGVDSAEHAHGDSSFTLVQRPLDKNIQPEHGCCMISAVVTVSFAVAP